MRHRTAILLIGVILTVGLSLVVGVGVVDVSAADTLVVDQDGTAEYSSIQTAIDDASAGDTVEIRPGTYAETIDVDKNITVTAPDGATLNGTDVDSPGAGVTIGGVDSENVEPTIRGTTITRFEDGIDATGENGDWTIRETEIASTGRAGIAASLTDGDWTIRETEVRETGETGIEAGNADGDWTIRETEVRETGETGIEAGDADGDWVVQDTVVQDALTENSMGVISLVGGIDASAADGDWTIRNVSIQDLGVDTSTLGEWRIRQSIINEDEGTAISATDATAEGIATDNWWGSPSGPDENACVGNVDCSDPLTTRPSDVGYNPDGGDESTLTPTPTPTPTPSKDIQIEYAPAVAIGDTTLSPQANGVALDVAVSEGSVGFGGTETAVIRIRQPRTGASLTITPNTTQEYNVTDFDTQNLYDADGSLKSPMNDKVSISTENNQFTEIDVTVSGDEEMFNRSIFAQYVVELQTAQGTVLDETEPGLRAVGYPGQFSQNATEGTIEVTFPRVASVNDSWDVEYEIANEKRETLLSKPVANVQRQDNFSVNVSSGRLSEGTYRQDLILKQTESDPVNKRILRVFDLGGIRITDGNSNSETDTDLVAEYAGEDDTVGPFDVITAIDDFRQQQLGPFEVLEIIQAFRD